jgi:hypothetical protein
VKTQNRKRPGGATVPAVIGLWKSTCSYRVSKPKGEYRMSEVTMGVRCCAACRRVLRTACAITFVASVAGNGSYGKSD